MSNKFKGNKNKLTAADVNGLIESQLYLNEMQRRCSEY